MQLKEVIKCITIGFIIAITSACKSRDNRGDMTSAVPSYKESNTGDLPSNTGVKFDSSQILLVDHYYTSSDDNGLNLSEDSDSNNNKIMEQIATGIALIGVGFAGEKLFSKKEKSVMSDQSLKNIELEKKLTERTTELENIKTELNKQNIDFAEKQKKIEKLEGEKASLADSSNALEQSLAESQRGKEALVAELNAKTQELNEAKSEYQKVSEAAGQDKNLVEFQKGKIKDLKSKVENLKNQVGKSDKEYRNLKENQDLLANSTRIIRNKDGSSLFLKEDPDGVKEHFGTEYAFIHPGANANESPSITRGMLYTKTVNGLNNASAFNDALLMRNLNEGGPAERLMIYHKNKEEIFTGLGQPGRKDNWNPKIEKRLGAIKEENILHYWAKAEEGFSIYALKFKGDPPQYGFIKLKTIEQKP